MKCKYQESCGFDVCVTDCCSYYEAATMTNGDRIRAMSDEELAELLRDAYDAGSDDAEAWYLGDGHRFSFIWDQEWLQQAAKEDDHDSPHEG